MRPGMTSSSTIGRPTRFGTMTAGPCGRPAPTLQPGTKPSATAPISPDESGRDGAAATVAEPTESERTEPKDTEAARPSPAPSRPSAAPTGRRRRHRDPAAGRRGPRGGQHDHLPHGADRDECPGRAGQADGRQPRSDQQPSAPGAGGQGQLHPSDRLRDRQGARRLPRDEQPFRRDRRPADAPRAGTRQLGDRDRPGRQGEHSVPGRGEHQARRGHVLRRVLERLRGHHPAGPGRQARRGRLRRNHDHPHQPGHHRHEPLRPPADGGPGNDRGRRSHGVSGRVQRHESGDARRAGDQQDHDADLDVRPPHHPGGPVRRVPAPGARVAARRRVLRRDLRGAADSVRAGALVGRPGVHPRGPDRQECPRHRAHQRLPHQRPPDGRHRPARIHRPDPSRPGHHPARPDPVGSGPVVPGRRFRRREAHETAGHPRRARATRTAAGSASSTCTSPTRPSAGGCRLTSRSRAAPRTATSSYTSSAGSTPRRLWRPSCRRSTWGRSGSAWRAPRRSSPYWMRCCPRPPTKTWTRSSSACRTADDSTYWRISSASRTGRSSTSSRETSTPARPKARATSSTTWARRARSTRRAEPRSPFR